jgi:hypothetical protein
MQAISVLQKKRSKESVILSFNRYKLNNSLIFKEKTAMHWFKGTKLRKIL